MHGDDAIGALDVLSYERGRSPVGFHAEDVAPNKRGASSGASISRVSRAQRRPVLLLDHVGAI